MNRPVTEMPDKQRLSYEDKLILAPMVHIGTLPMRLLALDHGADIVYTEELIDWKLLRSVRRINDILGTIDYIDETDDTVTFRTCPKERDRVVLQIGTCDPARALEVGRKVQADVAGIDLNMGCPKSFSLRGRMGAALLSEPETAANILRTLVNNLNIPVTCKIRVLPDLDKTIDLCKILASTGISAIAVHGRTIDERPQHQNRDNYIKEIASQLSIPVIANGGSRDIKKYSDIFRFKEITGCSSVMLARAAEWNSSIFRKEGLLPMEDVIKAYLKYAVEFDNSPSNTKYCVQHILRDQQETPLGRQFLSTQTLEEICNVWNLTDYYRTKSQRRKLSNKRKISEDDDVTLMHCAFLKKSYSTELNFPKTILYQWTEKHKKQKPEYNTTHDDKLFRSVVTVDGKKFGSSFWEKNKKWAEQGAALACLYSLGLIDHKTYAANNKLPS